MLNVSQQIWRIIQQELNLSLEQIDSLNKLFNRYNIDDLIFPRIIKKRIGIEMSDAYRILMILEKNGIVEKNYEYYCHDCGHFVGDIYATIGDIPEELYCETCGELLSFKHNTVIIYRVINIGK